MFRNTFSDFITYLLNEDEKSSSDYIRAVENAVINLITRYTASPITVAYSSFNSNY